MRRVLPLLLLAAGLSGHAALATAGPNDAAAPPALVTIGSISSDGVLHGKDGRALILADLRLPAGLGKRWAGQQAAAVALMRDLVAHKTVPGVVFGQDRWQRSMVSLSLDGGTLAAILLRRGLAVVDGRGDSRDLEPLYAAEETARHQRAGLWGLGYTVHDAAMPMPSGGFGIVEGRVQAVARVNGRTYVNFGADYKTDFTVLLEGDAARRFSAQGVSPDSLKGRRVRVRGMLEDWNGPLIRLTSPRSLEILGGSTDAP